MSPTLTSLAGIRAVIFDAVGTLLYPNPPVAEAYLRAARAQNISLSVEEIQARFHKAFLRQEQIDAGRANGATSEERERDRWRQIVAEVFPTAKRPGELFANLWDHFAQPQHWVLYGDVEEALQNLTGRGTIVGIASNFDSRLEEISRGHGVLSNCRRFISSQLKVRKPHRAFFAAVQTALSLPAQQIVLVGDSVEHDYQGAVAAGWQALLLCRDEHRERPPVKIGDLNVVRSLRELLALL